MHRFALGAALLPLALAACQLDSRQQVLATTNTQVAQRAISTRSFDTGDRARVFQSVIASLQDLGFVVDRADATLGTVSATRYGGGVVRFTVTVRPAGEVRTIVRASGQLNQHELSDPAPFQRFYDALSQALFLQTNQIE
ncbi:hypothetical protein [Paracraurococcus lichenis]|uniref:DUF4410 domain-containing protein n=1 Tax=Paracraurococcus lichenis TaxID=3064888 RepID=A0ABT9DX98_9PROT|nr:hypothetical protein [Paracraurococcus sp. LOR1-02]MDO9708521.1 hypothetical protein [Paracraurococcus sp. LOR1-02]